MDAPHLPPIFIAHDQPRELQPVRQHLEKTSVKNPLTFFTDADALVDFFRSLGLPLAKRNSAYPILLFIELNLPPNGAFEALRWIRQQPPIKEMPAIIIADTFDAKEVKRAASLGVARFVGRHAPPQVFADIIVDFCRDGTLP